VARLVCLVRGLWLGLRLGLSRDPDVRAGLRVVLSRCLVQEQRLCLGKEEAVADEVLIRAILLGSEVVARSLVLQRGSSRHLPWTVTALVRLSGPRAASGLLTAGLAWRWTHTSRPSISRHDGAYGPM
jgi:hypothetical protein